MLLCRKLTITKTKLKRTRSKEEAEESEPEIKRVKVNDNDLIEDTENVSTCIDENLAEYLKKKGISNISELEDMFNNEHVLDNHNHNKPQPKPLPKPKPKPPPKPQPKFPPKPQPKPQPKLPSKPSTGEPPKQAQIRPKYQYVPSKHMHGQQPNNGHSDKPK